MLLPRAGPKKSAKTTFLRDFSFKQKGLALEIASTFLACMWIYSKEGFVLFYVFLKFFELKIIFLPCIYGVYFKKIHRQYRGNLKDTGKFTNKKFHQNKY